MIHGPTVSFWGGPIDGTLFEAVLDSCFIEPPEWHRGYRRSVVSRHGKDNSVCSVKYVWREVWAK